MRLSASTFLLPLLLLFGLPVTAGASQNAFEVRARVLAAEPVFDTVSVPVESERCQYSKSAERADRAMSGDVRADRPSLSIANAISNGIRHREHNWRRYRCRIETEWEHRQQVVAYRVRFEYDGETFVRVLRDDPGDWIRVKVNLSAR